ncbi:cbb3-type cytochrome c oxidase subunit 3 [uncultured Parvibaculum sp.]|uniref:cbb3-type cytochrome c oxidase subunit 3 n=1 Tax=uncultured Parvibaculum sp. TaxID=291828 RepID=UPI0030D8B095|tara:strand:- start:23862 stop:24068 length:207 start_codon:yes stop_codon:yes gene_type:complete
MEPETTYSLVRTWAGAGGLVLMMVLFAMVLVYALRPGNKQTFDRLARLPLQDGDGPEDKAGDRMEAKK